MDLIIDRVTTSLGVVCSVPAGELAKYGLSPQEIEQAVNEQKWEIIRNRRSRLMFETDWTQVPDCQLSDGKKAEFTNYRQILRDIPQTYSKPDDVVWPVKPTI